MHPATSKANAPARLRHAAVMALVALTAFCAGSASVAAPTGTRFEPAAQVQGTRLLLNGAGTRFKAMKVYEMALYTPKKVGTTEVCWRCRARSVCSSPRCATCPAPTWAACS